MRTAEHAPGTHKPEPANVEPLLTSLLDFRAQLSTIEQKYRFLGTGFTSLCDETISRLNSETRPPAESPEDDYRNTAQSNPLVMVLDGAGRFLETGLDKMGDGIISVLGSLAKIGKSRGAGSGSFDREIASLRSQRQNK